MSHGITKTDRVVTYRIPSWHRLDTDVLEEYADLDDLRDKAHPFEVIREPVYRKQIVFAHNPYDPDGDPIPEEEYVLVPDQEFNVRTDNDEVLATVDTDRAEVSIAGMYEVAGVIQGTTTAPVKIETAGSFDGGRNVWLLLRLDREIQIKGDPNGRSLPFLAIQNGFKTGKAFRLQPTEIRECCANTSRAIDLDAERTGFQETFVHVGNMTERLEQAKESLANWYADIEAWVAAKEFLVTQKVDVEAINWFVNQFIPEPPLSQTSDRVKNNIEVARLELIGEIFGPYNEGIEMTALGLFEGASSWNEHVRQAMSPQTRFKRSVLSPDSKLSVARDLALQAAS